MPYTQVAQYRPVDQQHRFKLQVKMRGFLFCLSFHFLSHKWTSDHPEGGMSQIWLQARQESRKI